MSASLTHAAIAAVTVEGPVEVARDEGANYGDAWLGNGGFGFGDWSFVCTTSGISGTFLAGAEDDALDFIGSEAGNKAWGTYANTPSGDVAAVAFRGFGIDAQNWRNSLGSSGDIFRISMENDAVDNGWTGRPPGDARLPGFVGFSLRHKNVKSVPEDFTNGARFAFMFVGGSNTYSIVLGTNVWIDTGVIHTRDGLNLEFELTSPDAFEFRIYDASSSSNRLMTNIVGELASTGTIDSVSLFNVNSWTSGFVNTYFNFMSVEQYIPPTVIIVR